MAEEDGKRMSEWKKKLRTDIYTYKKQARRFFNIEGVVRIRKSVPKKEEQ